MAKKYRIIQGFTYKGKDGLSLRSVKLGPGEELPDLDPNERERLLREEVICEVSTNGENIRYKKLIDLDDEQVENLLKKPKHVIMAEIKNVMYSKDTLSKIYAEADRKKFGEPLLTLIEQKLSGEI